MKIKRGVSLQAPGEKEGRVGEGKGAGDKAGPEGAFAARDQAQNQFFGSPDSGPDTKGHGGVFCNWAERENKEKSWDNGQFPYFLFFLFFTNISLSSPQLSSHDCILVLVPVLVHSQCNYNGGREDRRL